MGAVHAYRDRVRAEVLAALDTVTNAEFLEFVESGCYARPQLWGNEDWRWKEAAGLAHPFARWRGGRLPTEAEFHRAAYGEPRGGERPFPWRGDEPTPRHGNFSFAHWSPVPVGSHPAGVSA